MPPRSELAAVRDCTHPRAGHTHGTPQAYNKDRCRCAPCRSAHAQRMSQRRRLFAYGQLREPFTTSIGSSRRLQALMCLGWSGESLAAQLGVTAPLATRLIREERARVTVATAKRVADLYDRLWDRSAPAGTSATKSRNLAAARGYCPPLAWDDDAIDNPKAKPSMGRPRGGRQVIVDEVAVERLKSGVAVAVNILERRAAIAELAEAGVRTGDIADRLGMTWTAAKRTRNRITAAERRTA